MSLGAIDFGLIVDGALIIVENAVRHMAERTHELRTPAHGRGARRGGAAAPAVEVRGAATFGVLIIGVVYLPILTLTGIEGKMFKPMAITVLFALAGALRPLADPRPGARVALPRRAR